MVFILSALLDKDKRLTKASWWQRLTEGETGSVLMSGAMLHKSLIQFSVDGLGCVPSLLFDLRPNYGGGNENNDDLQKVPGMHCCVQYPQPCSRPPLIQASARDSWTLTGKSGCLVGSLFLFPGSWCIQGFVCALQESVSPVLCKFWQLYSGVNGNLLQEGLSYTQVCCTQSPCPCGRPLLLTLTSTWDKHSKAGLAQSLWHLLVHRTFFLSPPSISGRYGVWF